MDTKTALGAAGGITLTVAGAVSALVLTLGGGTVAGDPTSEAPQDQIIEYVDQNGNPVSLDGSTPGQPAIPEIVITTDQAPSTGAADIETMAAANTDAAYGGAEGPEAYEEDEHEEDDHEEDEHEEDEHEDEGEEYEDD